MSEIFKRKVDKLILDKNKNRMKIRIYWRGDKLITDKELEDGTYKSVYYQRIYEIIVIKNGEIQDYKNFFAKKNQLITHLIMKDGKLKLRKDYRDGVLISTRNTL